METRIFECNKLECRVKTFVGLKMTPLNTCPDCQTFGSVLPLPLTPQETSK